jgi:transposase
MKRFGFRVILGHLTDFIDEKYSSDLSVIELVWAELKKYLSKKSCKTA